MSLLCGTQCTDEPTSVGLKKYNSCNYVKYSNYIFFHFDTAFSIVNTND